MSLLNPLTQGNQCILVKCITLAIFSVVTYPSFAFSQICYNL